MSTEKKELKVGDTVWLKPQGNNARYNREPREAKVVSIGKKYTYVSVGIGRDIKICKESGYVHSAYMANWKLYESKEEIVIENATNDMNLDISEAFRHGRSKYDYATVKAVHMILFPEKHTEL